MYFEDIKNEVVNVFGSDSSAVEIVENGRGGYDIICGSFDYSVNDWSEMDMVEQLYCDFLAERCAEEDFSDVPVLED